MSRNVEVVRRLYEAWQRDGYGVVQELMDPAIEYVNPSYAVEPGTRRGYDGFATAVGSMRSIYPDISLAPLEFYDAGDRVAVRVRVRARGAGSDIALDSERGYLFDVLDGRVVRFAWFNEPREALEAAGLTEQT
jgi:ketosteroid isomerase-like protein